MALLALAVIILGLTRSHSGVAEALAVLGFFGYALYLGAAALIVPLGTGAADRSAPQHAVHGEAGGYSRPPPLPWRRLPPAQVEPPCGQSDSRGPPSRAPQRGRGGARQD